MYLLLFSGVMNIDTGLETPRARPLSAGLWTLLSWLRREEHASNESLSSVGSDGTAVSFAFLAPPPPRARTAGVSLSPVSPPTDSYRKRVREGNVQRQHDRDLTLRSKYGLYRADNGYDALTLPGYDALTLPTRRSLIENSDKENRERRATSESFERRAAYVPGKRRAPLPPNFTATHSTSLTRRRTSRKRPAPKPPVKLEDQPNKSEKQDSLRAPALMNSKSGHVNPLTHTSNECKLEKYNKDDQVKDTTKNRTEKSFLKLLFESKKRNSSMETVPERVLPSISELDKQAAAIIESCKLKTLNEKGPNGSSLHAQTWFCTRCLTKYDSTMVSCTNCLFAQKINFNGLAPESKAVYSKPSDVYTQTQNAASLIGVGSSSKCGIEAKEKQKLKEMLKEMKNSLPKRPKHDGNESITIKNINKRNVTTLDTPTLRIGSTVSDEINELKLNPQPSSSNNAGATNCGGFNIRSNVGAEIKPTPTETVVVTQHAVLVRPRDESDKLSKPNDGDLSRTNNIKSHEGAISSDDHLHTPLKISSLLNPIYVPKNNTDNQMRRTLFFSQADAQATQKQTAEKQTSEITAKVTMPSTSIIGTNKLSELEESRKIKMALSHDVKSKEKENQNAELNSTSLSPPTANESNSSQKEPEQISPLSCKNKMFTPLITIPPVSKNSSSNNVSVRLTIEQHSRRRELINQLEKSIAKGDEAAAADAAMKLAQLRLSCSVLSFSSQIVGECSKSSLNQVQKRPTVSSNQNNLKTPSTAAKVNAAVQSMEIVSLNKISKSKDEVTVAEQKRINATSSSKITTTSQETKQSPFNEIKIGRELPKPKQIERPSTSNPTAKERTNDLRM